MWELLYSLRTKYITIPFTFDDNRKGFDFGYWTTDTPPDLPFTFDKNSNGFDIGYWVTKGYDPLVGQYLEFNNGQTLLDSAVWGTDDFSYNVNTQTSPYMTDLFAEH